MESACVAGVYTQPYTIFVPVAHFVWLGMQRSWRMLLATGAVIVLAGVAFVPWYRFSVPLWKEGLIAMYPQSTIGWRAIELILREIAGTRLLRVRAPDMRACHCF